MRTVERLSPLQSSDESHAVVGPDIILPLLLHLRPHWQLVLSPIFLWGLLLGGGAVTPGVIVVFVALHLFLYGGVTAYNSAYDRDEGPVSGLYQPPPVTAALLPFSLAMQLIGLLLVALVDARIVPVYLAYAALSVTYSHPRFRWKGSALGSALVIFFGQGVLAFLAGWLAAGATLAALAAASPVLGMLGASGATLALFPLSHLFQLEEDAERGDATLALTLGVQRTFRFAQTLLLGSGILIVGSVAASWGLLEATLVGSLFPAAAIGLEFWRRRFDAGDTLSTYRITMAVQVTLAAGFAAFVGWKLL